MDLNEEVLHILALQRVRNLGPIKAKRIIAHCGSARAVFEEKKQNLMKITGIGHLLVKELFDPQNFRNAEQELTYISKNDISYSMYTEDHYPKLLKQCVDGPLILFQSGCINFGEQPIISIVGSRKITQRGKHFCEQLIESLAFFDPIIVSGFAFGTDITAQKCAMDQGLQTVGCLAHGLNQMYPKAHKRYVERIERHGGFVTDFWSSDPFQRINFVKRNRIIAGMSEATIVIESAEKGGSLITADLARSYDRDVFAVPGRVNDNQSMGCNNLIKQHKAYMLSHPMDVPYMLNWDLDKAQSQDQTRGPSITLDPTEQRVYSFLKSNDKTEIDHIALQCNLPVSKIASILLAMELKGLIKSIPGKQFELI